jgi:two-component system, NtrC family, nitrogen regulation sensor histidine kinase NtrY
MVSNRFRLAIVIRVIILGMSVFFLCYCIIEYRHRPIFFLILLLTLLIVIQVIYLTYFILRTNRELTLFLMALKNSDYSIRFSGHRMERSFSELAGIMNNTLESFRELRIEKEIQVHLLKLITAEIKTGLLSINPNGKIVLMNYETQRLLGTGNVHSWGQLRAVCPSFVQEVDSMGNAGNKFTEIRVGHEKRKISLHVSTVPLMEEHVRIITLEDIQNQVERREEAAWMKLIRILMHEMMNSVTPLTSFTETISDILRDHSGNEKKLKEITEQDIHDVRFCLENIRKRKEHLFSFLENYKKLSHLPEPVTSAVCLNDIVKDVLYCMKSELDRSQIEVEVDPGLNNLVINADSVQIEQVLINLITNSIQAMQRSEKKVLLIRGLDKKQHAVIEILDTGEGIPGDQLDDIFVPFYSTKAGGSGIGLGLSRQIMLAHHGFIRVQSEPGSGSCFSLWFEKT